MDPYNEQTLRNEVIYLHSLWHQGPPPLSPPPFHHPPPLPHQPSIPPHSNQKRPSKRQRDRKKIKTNPSVQVSTTPWPCPPSPPPNSTAWPSFPPTHFLPNPDNHSSSLKIQSWAAGNQIQRQVVKEVKKFFNSQKDESDDDDVEDDVEMEDSDSDDDDYLVFFSKLFEENEGLKKFYENNCEDGEFSCLVCGGLGFIRRFKDCVALVQHTVTISKTKKRNAHRAFGQVVCKVLGWDIKNLSSIISEITDKKNASKLEENHHQGEGILINEAGNVESLGKGTGEKESAGADELPDNVVLAVAEADPDNDSKDVGRDVDACCVNEKGDTETKGKDASSDEKLPITDISKLADQRKEILDGKQENAESASNCVEFRIEDGSGKNESEDNQ